jgi:membrane associated rhomboid family serine protease
MPSLFFFIAKCESSGACPIARHGLSQRVVIGERVDQSREPILNVPAVVIILLVVLGAVHAFRMLVLGLDTAGDKELVWAFAFVPARYDPSVLNGVVLPGGDGARIWSFVTYAFLHSGLPHLGVNAVWLLAFGSPVARRFGSWRFIAFFLVTVAAGALAHLVTHVGELAPVIGASAAISGTMGAATRFVFQRGGPLDMRRQPIGIDPDRIPAAPLVVALRDPRVIMFLAIWFGLNLLFGLGSFSLAGEDEVVAWQAHIGGFVAGLLLFSAFDPIPPQPGANPPPLEN